jgi:RNA polymerase sigma factor (sigma-70 family)
LSQAAYNNRGMQNDDLVESLLDGDESAGAFLISRFAPLLLGYARLLGPDIPEADLEILCETAVEQAVNRIDRYDKTRGAFGSWLRGFVRHRVLQWRRDHVPTSELDEALLAAPTAEEPPQNDPPDAVLTLHRILEAVSPADRLIISLRDIEALPYAFIAEKLDATEEACRQRHRRALARLQAAVQTDESLAEGSRGEIRADRE